MEILSTSTLKMLSEPAVKAALDELMLRKVKSITAVLESGRPITISLLDY